jgi:hypothetical protein
MGGVVELGRRQSAGLERCEEFFVAHIAVARATQVF